MKNSMIGVMNKLCTSFFIVALLFQSMVPVPWVAAKSNVENPTPALNSVEEITLGSAIAPENRVPALAVTDFAKTVAEQAAAAPQVQARLRLKLSATPAIYIPGKPLQIGWSLEGLNTVGATAATQPKLSLQAPAGVTPSEPTLKASMNAQGLLNLN